MKRDERKPESDRREPANGSRPPPATGEHELDVADVAFQERGFAVAEVEVEQPQAGVVDQRCP